MSRSERSVSYCVYRLVGLTAAVMFWSSPSDAAAAEPETSVSGELDVGVFAERRVGGDLASASPMARFNLRLRPRVELGVSMGAVTLSQKTQQGRKDAMRPSNLGLTARYVRERWQGKYRATHIGLSFVFPTAVGLRDKELQVYDYALGTRGGLNPWDWSPRDLSFVIPAGLQAQIVRGLVVGADAAVGGMFSAGGSPELPAFVGQIAGQARYVLPWFAVGVRAQAVYNGRHPTDKTQAAVGPLLDMSLCRRQHEERGGGRDSVQGPNQSRAANATQVQTPAPAQGRQRRARGGAVQGVVSQTSPQCPATLRAQFNVNLDRPYGLASGSAKRFWGLQVGLRWAVF